MQSSQAQSPNVPFYQFGMFWPQSGPFKVSQLPDYIFHLYVTIGAHKVAQLSSDLTEQVKSDL